MTSSNSNGFSGKITRRTALTAIAGTLATPALVRISRAAASGDPILVGLSAALTGQFAQNGAWMKNGTSLAAKEINAKGGVNGRPIKLVVEDDQGPNPTAAVNAVTKLITRDEVTAIIGPHFTPAILPSEPLLMQYKVPALTGASGPVVTEQHNPFVFRVRLDDATGAALLVKYVLDTLKWKRIGLCYVNTAFGQSGIGAVKKALDARKVNPVISQTHLDSTKDFTAQILAFKNAKVDGIIAWTDDQPSGLIAKQMQTLGVDFKLAGSTTFSQPPFLELAGPAANGIYSVTDFTKDNPKPAIQDWKKRYKAAYGQEPELYASTYYDAMNLLAAAMQDLKSIDGAAVQAALTKISGHEGVMTSYSYSSNGDMVHSGLITQVKKEVPVIVETVGEKA